MSTFPNSPKLLKGGLVLLDPDSSAIKRVVALQYNPESVTRTLQSQSVGADGSDRSEALRLKGPPVETIRLEAEMDATDPLEFPQQNGEVVENGLHSQLAVLELMLYPSSADLLANDALASRGTLEIVPMLAPLTLFVWSKQRILPVRITEFSITEEAFDTELNPIRVKLSLGMRVLTVNDLGFGTKGGNLYMAYLQQKERLAQKAVSSALSILGPQSI